MNSSTPKPQNPKTPRGVFCENECGPTDWRKYYNFAKANRIQGNHFGYINQQQQQNIAQEQTPKEQYFKQNNNMRETPTNSVPSSITKTKVHFCKRVSFDYPAQTLSLSAIGSLCQKVWSQKAFSSLGRQSNVSKRSQSWIQKNFGRFQLQKTLKSFLTLLLIIQILLAELCLKPNLLDVFGVNASDMITNDQNFWSSTVLQQNCAAANANWSPMDQSNFKNFVFKESNISNDMSKMAGLKKTGSGNCSICFDPSDLSGTPIIGTIITRYHKDTSATASITMAGRAADNSNFQLCTNCNHGVLSWDYNSRVNSNRICFQSTNAANFYFQSIQIFENVELGFLGMLSVDFFGYHQWSATNIDHLISGEIKYGHDSFYGGAASNFCFFTYQSGSSTDGSGSHPGNSILKVDISGNWEVTQILNWNNYSNESNKFHVFVVTDVQASADLTMSAQSLWYDHKDNYSASGTDFAQYLETTRQFAKVVNDLDIQGDCTHVACKTARSIIFIQKDAQKRFVSCGVQIIAKPPVQCPTPSPASQQTCQQEYDSQALLQNFNPLGQDIANMFIPEAGIVSSSIFGGASTNISGLCPLETDCSSMGTYKVFVREIDPTNCQNPLSDDAMICWNGQLPTNEAELTTTHVQFTQVLPNTINQQYFTVSQWSPGQKYFVGVVLFYSSVIDSSGNPIQTQSNYFWMRNEAISDCPDPHFEIDPTCATFPADYTVKLDNLSHLLDCDILLMPNPTFTGTDPCPLFCSEPGFDTFCPTDGEIFCQDILAPSWFNFPSTTFSLTTTQVVTDNYSFSVQSADINLDQLTFECQMRTTTLTPTIDHPQSKFTIKFTICGVSSFCSLQTWQDINQPSPFFPDFIAVKGSNSDSDIWVFPQDSTTNNCSYAQDCHAFMSLSLEVDTCASCSNYKYSATCDMTCTTFTPFTDVSFTEVDPLNGDHKFTVLSSWDTRQNFVARIKGVSNFGQTVYSPEFLFLTEASQECNIALLTIPVPEPTIVFNPVRPSFGQSDSFSITSWPLYENDVCPEFCHGTTDCGTLVYSLRCMSGLVATAPYNDDPHALQQFNATIDYTGQVAVNAWEILSVLTPYHCVVHAQLPTGPSIETGTPSEINFDICFSFDLGCKINTWDGQTAEDTHPFQLAPWADTSWTPPPDLYYQLYDVPVNNTFIFKDWLDNFSILCPLDVDPCGQRHFNYTLLGDDTAYELGFDHTIYYDYQPGELIMELQSHNVTQIGVYELQIVGMQISPFNPSYNLQVVYEKIVVEIYDPCIHAIFVPSEEFSPDKPDDILDFFLDGQQRFTYHKQFSDNVTEIFYDENNSEHEYPLCGVPIGYKVLAPNNDPLPLICTAEHDLGTFDVTVICASADVSLDGLVIEAKIVAFNATLTDPETNIGESQSFYIYCVKPPEENPFTIQTSAPVIDTFPDNLDLNLDRDDLANMDFEVSISDSTNDLKSVSVTAGTLSPFLTESWSSLGVGTLTFKPSKKMPIGSFSVTLVAEDQDGNKTSKVWTITIKGTDIQTTFFIKEEIVEEEEVKEEELDPIFAWIESVDQIGNVDIRFSVPVLAVQNVSQVQKNDFQIIFEQMSNEADQAEQFRFNITESTPEGLKCKLFFAEALSISTGQVEDRIKIYMRIEVFMNRDTEDWHKTYQNPYSIVELTEEEKERQEDKKQNSEFLGIDLDEKLEKSTNETENTYPWSQFSKKRYSRLDYQSDYLFQKLLKDIPPQVEEAAAKTIGDQAKNTDLLLKITFWLPFLVQIFMSAAMSHVWNVLNTLQVINTFPLFSFQIPENVRQILISCNSIAQMKILDKESIFAYVDAWMVDPVPEGQEKEDSKAKSAQESQTQVKKTTNKDKTMESFGMSSDKILQAAIQLIIAGVIISLLILLLKFFQEYVLYRTPQFVQFIFRKISQKLMWNSILRTTIESYYGIAMSVALNMRDSEISWDNPTQTINSIGRLLFLPFLVGFPIWTYKFLVKNRFRLSDIDFKARYDTLYLNVDYFKPRGLRFIQLLLFRRAIMVINAIFFGVSPLLQISVCIYASQIMCQFFVRIFPMLDRMNNSIQIFNEWSLLTLAILLFNFTEYNPDPAFRFQLGWYFIYLIYFNLGINGCIIASALVFKIRHNIKMYRHKQKVKEIMQGRLRARKLRDFILSGLNPQDRKKWLQKWIEEQKKNNSDFSIESINLDEIGQDNQSVQLKLYSEQQQDLSKITDPYKRANETRKRRLNRKERFEKMMQDGKKRDQEERMKKIEKAKERGEILEPTDFEQTKALGIKARELIGPEPEAWEKNVWSDVLQDTHGNLLKQRENKETGAVDWEIVSSESVRMRRQMQEHCDWPLSARDLHSLGLKGKRIKMTEQEKMAWMADDGQNQGDIQDWTIMLPDNFSTGTKVEEVVQKASKLIQTKQRDVTETDFFRQKNNFMTTKQKLAIFNPVEEQYVNANHEEFDIFDEEMEIYGEKYKSKLIEIEEEKKQDESQLVDRRQDSQKSLSQSNLIQSSLHSCASSKRSNFTQKLENFEKQASVLHKQQRIQEETSEMQELDNAKLDTIIPESGEIDWTKNHQNIAKKVYLARF